MPEGHTIHRQARLQTKKFVDVPLEVSSPQGRFAAGAASLAGQSIKEIEARGKHLFYWWDNGSLLHIHLGLFGKFRSHSNPAPPPTDGTRLQLRTAEHTLHLSGPTICELVDVDERDEIVARLGPDPLAGVPTAQAVPHISELMSRRASPVSVALLDQRVIAGIGNVYRSELLFLTGINPLTPAKHVTPEQVEALWTESVAQLRLGERSGRIVTTRPGDVGVTKRSEIGRGGRTYVYKRQGKDCRICGTTIQMREPANRKVWWCPNCQP